MNDRDQKPHGDRVLSPQDVQGGFGPCLASACSDRQILGLMKLSEELQLELGKHEGWVHLTSERSTLDLRNLCSAMDGKSELNWSVWICAVTLQYF